MIAQPIKLCSRLWLLVVVLELLMRLSLSMFILSTPSIRLYVQPWVICVVDWYNNYTSSRHKVIVIESAIVFESRSFSFVFEVFERNDDKLISGRAQDRSRDTALIWVNWS